MGADGEIGQSTELESQRQVLIVDLLAVAVP
jgi:hypothetical protein